MHRNMPNGGPAVYKLVTHLVTYPWGNVETVTPNSTVVYHITPVQASLPAAVYFSMTKRLHVPRTLRHAIAHKGVHNW